MWRLFVCVKARESRSESNKKCAKCCKNGHIIVNGVNSFGSGLMHLSAHAARKRSLSPSRSEFDTAALKCHRAIR